ncbi:PHD finger protein 3 [Trichonephila clavata]|uniref:PHD finger protein 3 n=1 Tax=Trichonephila clavata TaxID=2740835 RepID=A0A8X6J2J4_TRICU|nr:PHD finger protein 3 [Trichonephila clavata]
MAAEKSLIMNVSKDEMDTIDEILQSRQPGIFIKKKPLKLPSSSRTFTSAPLRITVPLNVSLEAVGALCELSADPGRNQCVTECVESDDENNVEEVSYVSKNLEDLISVEHSYATNYFVGIKSNVNENAINIEKEGDSISESANSEQVPIEEIEISNISTPIRRSKRQIEKLEREQGEKQNATDENLLDNNCSQMKMVKTNEVFDEKETESRKNEINSNSDVLQIKTSKYSIYKSYSEFKKRHLKNIDSSENKESKEYKDLSNVTSNAIEEIQDAFNGIKKEKDSLTDMEELHDIDPPGHEPKSKYSRKTKLCKVNDVEQSKKINSPTEEQYSVILKQKKTTENSPECNMKKAKKRLKKKCLAINKVSDESEPKLKSTNAKRKFSSHSFGKNAVHLESTHFPEALHISKRKKCVSFSEDLFSDVKPEAVPKRQRLSTDSKDMIQKNTWSPLTSPTMLSVKPLKKKILRRESLRLTMNEDEPPLFSKPDVMIKVTVDDTASKKDEKEIDPNSLNQAGETKNLKLDDIPAMKNDTKEKQEVKNKTLPNDKQEEKEKQEVEKKILPNDKQEEKEKQEVKIKTLTNDKQEEKEKQEVKNKTLPNDKQEEKEKQVKNKTLPNDKQKGKEKQVKNKTLPNDKQEDKEKLEVNNKTLPNDKQEEKEIKKKTVPNDKQKDKEKLEVNNKTLPNDKQEEKEKQEVKNKTLSDEKQEEKEKLMLKMKQVDKEKHALKVKQEKVKQTLKTRVKVKVECQEEENRTEDGQFKPIFTGNQESVDQSNISNNFQDTEHGESQQMKCESTYLNDSVRSHTIFSNIEALFEAVKYNESLLDSISTPVPSEKKDINENDNTKNALNQDCTNDSLKAVTDTESDNRTAEATQKPERKSRRIIKKKEFFGDSSDSSDNKRTSGVKRKKSKIDKGRTRAGTALKNKISNINKEKDLSGRNGHLEFDGNAYSDTSEEDDPNKLWCICRRPHNSRFMIQCDKCEEWFHGSCVGVTKLYGRQLEEQKKEWICPVCRMKGETFVPKDEKSQNEIYELENLHTKISKKSGKANNRCGTHEKMKAISDTQNFVNLENIKTPVHDFKTPVHDFKTPVHDFKTPVHDFKTPVLDFKTPVHDALISVHEVKSPIHETKTPMHEVKSPVHEIKIPMQEEKIHVLEEHSFVQEVKTSVPEVKTTIEELNTCVQEVKTPVKLSTNDGSLNSGNSVKKGHSNAKVMPKAVKGPKKKKSKQSAHFRTSIASKQNLLVNLLPLAHRRKISMSSKKFASSTMKSRAQKKFSNLSKESVFLPEGIVQNKKDTNVKTPSHDAERPTFEPSLEIKKRSNVPLKEKGNFKKKLSCVNCNSEAKANACYCSDNCIEKYATECLKTIREVKGTSMGVDFDSQRLVVLDRLKGNVITSENGPTAGEIISWLKANPSFIIFPTPCVPSSVKKEKECEPTSGTEKKDAADEKAKATVRLNVRKTLKNILMDRCKKADDIEMPEEDIQKIAVKIEEELNSLFKDNSFKYRAKYRSLMFNIKDPRNQGLFRKILKGNIPPDRLVRMSPEELASLELARWREQENQHLLDMIKRVQLEQQKSGNGLLLKKTHKGEVEIEDHLTSVIEDIPKTELKDILEDLEPEKEEIKDSTHLHRSHLFDLNCKICTGKIVPPPTDENISKKVRVAHSISVEHDSPSTSDTSEKSVSKTVDEKSPVSNSGEDSLDRESASSVSFASPVVGVKPCIIEPSSKAVWKGFIFMQDVAKFVTSAYKVSGHTDRLQADLPDTIHVCGRIIPDQVWDYLSKIKQSGNKELIIIHFQAANEEEALAYSSFYSYLNSRKRYGVVSSYSRRIKDFYLLPLAPTSPVPMVLVPFDGPGLPSPRPHLLLGVIVRHKPKKTSVPFVPKELPQSLTESEYSDSSYTPPDEPRSYTPPLPTAPTDDHGTTADDKKSSNASANKPPYDKLKSKKTFTDIAIGKKSSFSDKELSYAKFSEEKDDDKPYDPEQEINTMPSGPKNEKNSICCLQDGKESSVPATASLENHKKILDALTRQVEETDRQVNALKQLISQPEDDMALDSPNAQSLDISSVTETGMSSFLDLPENLQAILNAVRLKSNDKEKIIHEKGDVDMRIRTLFGKHFSERKIDKIQPATGVDSEEIRFTQASTPPHDEDMDESSDGCLSDPRIKLKTNFHETSAMSKEVPPANASLIDVSASELIAHAQKQFTGETGSAVPLSNQKPNSAIEPPKMLLTSWNPGEEPPPPGIEPSEQFSEENVPVNVSHTATPPVYTTTALVHDSSQHINSTFLPQSFASFQPRLPLGFSVHTPPPNIKHFPPPPIIPSPFPPPPPPPLPMHIVPTNGSENNLIKEQWSGVQLPSHHSEGTDWPTGTSHCYETSEHQGNPMEGDSQYRPEDYNSDNFYKKDTSDRHWAKPQNFVGGTWVKHPSRRDRFEHHRRGKRGSSFRRNMRK